MHVRISEAVCCCVCPTCQARCWDRGRADWSEVHSPTEYFDDLLRGTHCLTTDWHENAPAGNSGNSWQVSFELN